MNTFITAPNKTILYFFYCFINSEPEDNLTVVNSFQLTVCYLLKNEIFVL